MLRRASSPDVSWLLLAALTVLGVVLFGTSAPASVTDTLLLIIALIKARQICLGYLGLGTAPAGWRNGIAAGVLVVVAAAWVVGMAAALA